MIKKCEWCGTQYPDFDETEEFYNAYVWGKPHVICGSCKKHLRKLEKESKEK